MPLRRVDNLEPRLASWNSKSDPAQIGLQAYLTDVAARLGALPDTPNLFLHLQIDVREPARLLDGRDLENYLTPLVAKLGASRFVLVSATKRVGGGSYLSIGQAINWKQSIREHLLASGMPVLPPGSVDVQLAFRCSARRNWPQLWKPAGDAMGPILGEPRLDKPFNPADDPILSIAFHRLVDGNRGHDVQIGMWWRPAQT
jgi:hypothetical protein